MKTYAIRYIYGYQTQLKQEDWGRVQAESPEEALRGRSDWPIETRFNRTTAWAKNPGTSLYVVEAWEADECDAGKMEESRTG